MFSSEVLPIDDPWEEKETIEKRKITYSVYLIRKLGAESIGFTKESVHNRIREVYRLCFESRDKKDMEVIDDFVAFHPGLAFDTPWLDLLVHEHTVFDEPWEGSYRTRLLMALASGFERAAYSKLATGRRFRSMKLNWGRIWVEALKDELLRFYGSVDWIHADKEEVVTEKITELVKRYPRLEESREKLTEHLLHKRVKAAAQFIVNKVLRVGIHDLRSKATN